MIRFLDIIFSGFSIIILLPLFLIVIIVLKFTAEGEVFFYQKRIGKNNSFFNLIKFATMAKNSPYIGSKTITLKNDSRIFPVGKFLRKFKINELPQLVNILIGDMSVIGPRPLTKENFEAYPKEIKKIVTQIRPGLSGIGSIIFKNEEIFLNNKNSKQVYFLLIAPYKGELEKWFVKNYSIVNYLLLILLTIYVLIFQDYKMPWRIFRDLPKPPKKIFQKLH